MQNLEPRKLSKEEYNSIPVYYCRECLSLRVRSLDDDTCYCDDCGSTDIDKDSIDNWEVMKNKKDINNLLNK